MVSRHEVEAMILAALRRGECTAAWPHEGKLQYLRGAPSVYVCDCGKRYLKNGRGGLMDVPPTVEGVR